MRREDSELTVITRAKELCTYILSVTDKSPKKFRFTLISRLQGYALDIIENLYFANAIVLTLTVTEKEIQNRRDYQNKAMTCLRLLGYMAVISRESQCILPKQQRVISDKILETQKLLYAWEKSDEDRITKYISNKG